MFLLVIWWWRFSFSRWIRSGKSVITKTFTGMIESNGWISDGSIIYKPNQKSKDDNQTF